MISRWGKKLPLFHCDLSSWKNFNWWYHIEKTDTASKHRVERVYTRLNMFHEVVIKSLLTCITRCVNESCIWENFQKKKKVLFRLAKAEKKFRRKKWFLQSECAREAAEKYWRLNKIKKKKLKPAVKRQREKRQEYSV